jgi:hypothetical protein
MQLTDWETRCWENNSIQHSEPQGNLQVIKNSNAYKIITFIIVI